jgi:hypothetical protein
MALLRFEFMFLALFWPFFYPLFSRSAALAGSPDFCSSWKLFELSLIKPDG